MQFDVDAIKSAGRGCWGAVVCTLAGFPREHFDGGYHACPKCGGKDRFRFSNVDGSGSTICSQCGKNGDGIATVMWALGVDFNEACRILMKELRITKESTTEHATSGDLQQTKPQPQPATRKPEKDPSANIAPLEIRPQQAHILLSLWAATHKPGISPNSITDNGGCLATYKPNPKYSGFQVVAIPAYDSPFPGSQPCGWAMYQRDGSEFKVNSQPCKIKQTDGSRGGLFGLHALKILSDPSTRKKIQVVFKVEGLSDFLSLYSKIPPELRDTHLVISNSCGATENPYSWALDLLAGLTVYVVHDCDEPGQQGATWILRDGKPPKPGWCPSLATKSREVRNVILPYEIAESHGKDLRDWINEGGTYQQLLSLAAAADIWPKPAPNSIETEDSSPSPTSPGKDDSDPPDSPGDLETDGLTPNEEDNDPDRLARIYLEKYTRQHPDGLTLRYWRDSWQRWTGSHYIEQPESDLRAAIHTCVKQEFNRINLERLAAYYYRLEHPIPPKNGEESSEPKGPPTALKVSRTIVGNTLGALESICLLPSQTEAGCWLLDDSPTQHQWTSLQNGIMKFDELLANAPSHESFVCHSPAWFSPVCLPYRYVPDAVCPIWQAFTERVTESDAERLSIIQEWAGYLLTPDTSLQKFLMLEGEGSNGKSVYCAGIEALLGQDNVSHVSVENFGNQFALYGTVGRLANIVADIGELDRIAEGFLKSFVSGDRMTFDRKNKTPVECLPTARLMIATNNRPRFSDKSSGIWRRVLVVPFLAEITQSERILGMDHSRWWYDAGELPGILNWAIEGLRRLKSQGRFTESWISDQATEDYKRETNPAKAFLIEHYEACDHADSFGNPNEIATKEVYKKYREYCSENGNSPTNETNFGKEVYRHFRRATRVRRRFGAERWYAYQGIRDLNPANELEIVNRDARRSGKNSENSEPEISDDEKFSRDQEIIREKYRHIDGIFDDT